MSKNKPASVRYIVHLKDDFVMPHTTINRTFCASIEHISDRIYFKLHGSDALVIVPHDKIEWMAPSRILWKEGYTYAE